MLDLSVAMFDFQRVPAPSHSPAISPPGVGFKECHGGRRHGRVCVRKKKTTADFSENHKSYAAGLGV